MRQTHGLADCQNEGALVLVFGDLLLLAPVVGLVLQVVLAEQVRAQDEVAAQTDVADFCQAGALGDKVGGRALVPGQATRLRQVPLLLEVWPRSAADWAPRQLLVTRKRSSISCIRTLAIALCRTGRACAFEVPPGVGNSLRFEVTWRCNMEDHNCPPDRLRANGHCPWDTTP
jgi:hypothetical protein